MNIMEKDILEQWLEIEFCSVANKTGLISTDVVIDEKLIYDSIRCLDFETIVNDNSSVNYVITIIALMWEYVDKSKYDIKDLVIKFLSRIGYPTSAIIADNEFDKDECSFGQLKSVIDKITTTLNQSDNEINVCGHKYLLTAYQKNIWDSLDDNRIIGISAPTSAGKSFVLLLKMVERISAESIDVVYIVPTLSLLNQVTEDFNRELKICNAKDYCISNSFDEDTQENKNYVYVLTQEKAIAAFSDNTHPFSKPLVLIVDEIQNIERVQDPSDERAKRLFDTLIEFRNKENVKQIIISGPRINNIGYTGSSIFGQKAKDLTTDISPVLNLTYSIQKKNNEYYLKQYCALTDKPHYKKITNSNVIKGYGQKQYNDSYLSFFDDFYKGIGCNQQNIIFAPTSSTARTIAQKLSGKATNGSTDDLIEYYKATIHKKYTMCDTLSKGIAYHHGKLPMHVRRTLENAITEKKITTVVCTTTLMQGVNMPAQNIFIRNPHLYIRKTHGAAELSTYEMANLRGRAGRLLKDFIGRTYVMDESEFAGTDCYEQMSLFEDTTKDLPKGYQERFEEYESKILSAVNSNDPICEDMSNYGYLVSYIRQLILRYGNESTRIMKNVGIKFTKEQVAAIIMKLNELTIPKSVCLKNRYWDPFILEEIYTKCNLDVPKTPSERGVKTKMDKLMRFLRDNNVTSQMYNKYIPKIYRNGSARIKLRNLSLDWANEKTLYDILDNLPITTVDTAKAIEDTIELLQNTVSYNLPLLLKPIFDIKAPDSSFLTCLQAGAINIIPRNMIEMGIPRETALSLYKDYFSDISIKDISIADIDALIRDRLSAIYTKLPNLIQVQINFLI